ncbi:glycosyl hydrolase [Massilioclostridium coli]|uniref:glycosyl hydrolase n=1 Tax=Massilioclostridium coli TaxID=1870991 RepID=UPI00085C9CB7|nr:glycosyl hydrolase [Massilioclostridium coli]
MKKRILSSILALGMLASIATGTVANAADANSPEAKSFQQTLTEKYVDPDRTYSTDIRWWIGEAANTDEVLLDEIQALYDAGFRNIELCMQSDMGADDDTYAYGSEMWSHKWKLMMNKLLDLGMGVSLTSGTNWSTSNVPGLDPDSQAAMQNVSLGTTTVEASGKLTVLPVPEGRRDVATFVGAYAYRETADNVVDYDSMIDLSGMVTQGANVWEQNLDWTAPDDGNYRIFAIWSQGTAQSASPSAETSYTTNYFDERGIEALKEFWLEHYLNDPELNEKIKNGTVNLFMDSIEIKPGSGFTYWSEDMADEFIERKGYDIRPYLFLLDGVKADVFNPYNKIDGTYNLTDDNNTREKITNDFLEVLTDIYREKMLVPLKEWLNSYGIETRAQISYGQPMEISEPIMDVDYPEAENLNQSNQVDIFRLWTGGAKLENKILSSETSAIKQAYSYSAQKHLKDAYSLYAAGFQRIVWHVWASDYGYGNYAWPGFAPGVFGLDWFHYFGTRNPGYRDYDELNAHLGRVQQLMQTGKSRTDVGFIHNNWTQGIRKDGGTGNDLSAMNWELAHQGVYYRSTELQDNGYTYDYFSPDFLYDDSVSFNEETQTIESAGYKAIVLYQDWLDVKGAERILDWAKKGLKVVILDGAAQRTPFNDGNDEKLAEIMAELKTLSTVRTAEIYDAPEGFNYADAVEGGYDDGVYEALQELGVTPYAEYVEPNHQLLTQTRQDEDGNQYLYAYNYCSNDYHQNSHIESVQNEDHGTNIKTEIKMDGMFIPYSIDPWTGEVTELGEYRYENGQTIIPIDLDYANIALFAFEAVDQEKTHIVSTNADSAYIQDGTMNIRATESGTYNTTLNNGTTYQSNVEVPEAYDITNWDLTVESWTAGDEVLEKSETIGDVTTVNRKTATKKTDINVKLDKMTTWTNIPEVGQDVSGLGHYEATFNWDASKADGAYLDFGDNLEESMEVWINGQKVGGTESSKKPGYTGGVSWTKPVADISDYLVDGENSIVIEYSSTLANIQLERGVVKVEHNASGWWGYDIDYADYGPEQAVIVPYSEVSLEESQANKGILNSVIQYAEAAKESGEYDNAIESVQKSFDAALENAKTVANNAGATQEEVNAAWKTLLNEIHKLGFVAGDKTELASLIEAANEINAELDRYVEAGKAEFTAALEAAVAVYEDGDAMQAEINQVADDLLNAMLNLRFKADKSILEEVLAEASEVDANAYTAESYAALQAAVAEASDVYNNENATQEEVDAAVTSVQTAMDNLVAVDGTPAETPTENNNTAGSQTGQESTTPKANAAKTGDFAPIAGMAAIAIAGAALVLSRKKK